MSVVRSTFGFVLLCGCLCLQANGASASQRPAARRHSAKPEQEPPAPVPPAAPPGPLTQLSLSQIPANPPVVEYQNGELTIIAQNSTLDAILRGVHTKTGAAIDIPPNAKERVVSRFGPGPARQVLAELLDGSNFNYIMMGSATDANAVATVILTPKRSAMPENAAENQPAAMPVPQPRGQLGSNPQVVTAVDDEPDEPFYAPDQPEAQQTGANAIAPQPAVKTPEQMLQEMQQQQLQQQQSAPPGSTPQPGPPPK